MHEPAARSAPTARGTAPTATSGGERDAPGCGVAGYCQRAGGRPRMGRREPCQASRALSAGEPPEDARRGQSARLRLLLRSAAHWPARATRTRLPCDRRLMLTGPASGRPEQRNARLVTGHVRCALRRSAPCRRRSPGRCGGSIASTSPPHTTRSLRRTGRGGTKSRSRRRPGPLSAPRCRVPPFPSCH
jgi:hypothetical protein